MRLTKEEMYRKKSEVQEMLYQAWVDSGMKAQEYIATGVGKTRLAILAHIRNFKDCKEGEILLAVPTRKLRDRNWEIEYDTWATPEDYQKLRRTCYRSISKIKNTHFKYIILDEAHNITEESFKFFSHNNNTYDAILILSATEPRDLGKQVMLRQLAPVAATYTLDQGIADGIVQEYNIVVVESKLDDTTKYIPAGSKAKGIFYQTEKDAYEYISKMIKKMAISKPKFLGIWTNKRMHFIYNLQSKLLIAQAVINQNLRNENTKLLVFCGNTEHADSIANTCGGKSYHSNQDKSTNDANFEEFAEADSGILVTCKSLNEGHTINKVTNGYIVQIREDSKDLIQQLGRTVRWKETPEPSVLYISVTRDTVDEKWLEEALEGIDRSRVMYVSYKNFVNNGKR